MFLLKQFSIMLTIIVLFIPFGRSYCHEQNSYLDCQDSFEIMIITEVETNSILINLYNISEAINNGDKSNDICTRLENIIYETQQISVARQAVKYLGQIDNDETRRILIRILNSEFDSIIIYETINVLGNKGINENNETIISIVCVFERFNNIRPDNLIAFATVNALENIIMYNNWLNSYYEVNRVLLRILDGIYIIPVKERARLIFNRINVTVNLTH